MISQNAPQLRWGPFEKNLKLTAAQEKLLHENTSPRVIITGPPGCGKTAALVLKGLQWLQTGHDVIVFGLHVLCMPSCRLVYCQLSEAYKRSQGPLFPKDRTWGRVLFEHELLQDARNLETTLRALLKYGNEPHVLMDDFCPDDGFQVEMMLVFMRELRGRVPGLHLWATDFFTKLPEAFDVQVLSEPVRYPLPLMQEVRVVVEVLKATEIIPDTHGYKFDDPSAAAFRPDVIHVRHSGGRGEQKWPLNSEKCGKQVAKLLRSIGVRDHTGTATDEKYTFRDVLIISRTSIIPDQPPPAFVRGLENSGFPTQVFGASGHILSSQDRLQNAFDDVILAKENKVTVMNCASARGLDRPVVVCLTGVAPSERYEFSAQDKHDFAESLKSSMTLTQNHGVVTQTVTLTNTPTKEHQREAKKAAVHQMKANMELKQRLEVWSRASEQLIVVHLPKGMEGGPSGTDDYGGSKCVIL